jgi:hypothetical protein
MSRIVVTIDHLLLNGMEPDSGKALTAALKAGLSQTLSDRTARTGWARPHRTPVMKLGRMPLDPGTAGGTKLGKQVAHAVARGLKP